MADEILFNTKIDVNYADAQKKLASLQKQIDRLTQKRDVDIDFQINKADRMLEVQRELEKEKEKLSKMDVFNSEKEDRVAQIEKVKALQTEYNKLKSVVDRYEDTIDKTNLQLNQAKTEAQQLAASMAQVQQAQAETQQTDAAKVENPQEKLSFWDRLRERIASVGRETQKTHKTTSHFFRRVKGLIKRVFIFSVITRALRAIRAMFSNILANSQETAQAFSNLKGSLLTLIQPLIDVLLPVLTTVFNILTKIVSFIATIFSALFGTTLQQSASNAEALNGAINGTADGLGGANDNAKKLKKTLAGFDTLNILEDPTDDASGGGGGGASASGISFSGVKALDFDIPGLEKVEAIGAKIFEIFKKIWDRIGGIVELVIEWAKQLNLEPLLDAILGLLDSILGLLDPIFDILETLWNDLLGPVLKMLIEEFLPPIIEVISGIIDGVKKIFTALQPILSKIFKLLQPMIEQGFIILGIITDLLGSGLEAILEIVAELLEVITPLIEWLLDLLQPIIELLTPILQLIGDIAKMIGDTLIFVLKLLIAIITLDFDAAKEAFGEYMGKMGENIKSFSGHFTKLKENVVKVWNAIKNAAITAWNGIKNVWNKVTTFFQNIIDSIKNAWEKGVNAIGGFFSNVFNGIRDIVVGVMNGVISAVESVINWCVDAINGFISGLNWVIQGIGKLLGQNWAGIGLVSHVSLGRVGGNTGPVGKPNAKSPYPLLAQGGVVPPNHRFMAVLGDNKEETEIVSPLSTMKQALSEALRETGFNGTIENKVYLDGRQIATNTSKYQQRARRAYGV